MLKRLILSVAFATSSIISAQAQTPIGRARYAGTIEGKNLWYYPETTRVFYYEGFFFRSIVIRMERHGQGANTYFVTDCRFNYFLLNTRYELLSPIKKIWSSDAAGMAVHASACD